MLREVYEMQEKIVTLLRKAARAGFLNQHTEVVKCQWQVLVLSVAADPLRQPVVASTLEFQGTIYCPQSLIDNTIKYVQADAYRTDEFVWQHPDLLERRAIELFGKDRGKEVLQYGRSYV